MGNERLQNSSGKGFLELFTFGHIGPALANWDPPSWKTHLQEDAMIALNYSISDKEISVGLWALKPFKALGSDGLHTGFF